ncbi:Bug family tripartite tricarboxylate transporter substrate binding protein [Actinomycetospora termitidis]|uniref:Tripartite tricarboxylate transporter substrate-binding protein n=1 Tax=Actinomycetospora termitidis TaxID=3053470 RepID=A0ABT7M4L5_9PSEU|nr:tripartite tricarboxylate transporter substrate-binding protein [Actinomycetospora sp. Odt1-22]MDL5155616.1 tripartite tricarboxylate transporter substrate-binding protein [Actinomycetospora sp. Odt1-22]
MRRAGLVLGVLVALLASCSTGTGDLRLLVPTEVGGGYDLTARTLAAALAEREGEPGPAVVVVPGDVGRAALARLAAASAEPDLLMVMGLGLLAAVPDGGSDPGGLRATPVARLITEPELVAVTADSPYRTLGEFVATWRADPARVVVGGISARGGPDWLVAARLAAAIGIAPGALRYAALPGDALLPALLRGDVAVAVTGLAETAPQTDLGTVRTLAVTSAARSPRVDAPTLREAGVDVVFENWRGVLAPPALSPDDVAGLAALVDGVRSTATWRAALARNGWTDAPLAGPGFAAFLDAERARVEEAMAGS